eukprot:4905902-Alexandrium_andersonii.AAC.1
MQGDPRHHTGSLPPAGPTSQAGRSAGPPPPTSAPDGGTKHGGGSKPEPPQPQAAMHTQQPQRRTCLWQQTAVASPIRDFFPHAVHNASGQAPCLIGTGLLGK